MAKLTSKKRPRLKKRPIPGPVEATHLINLQNNLGELGRLDEIHTIVTGGGAGYKHNVEVLNKSSVVLLVACWEAYIEDMATNSFSYMLNNANEPNNFPNKVLSTVAKEIKSDCDDRNMWKIAGDGWKQVLEDHKDELFKRNIGKLNTPRPDQIDNLYLHLIGLKNLSNCWYWPGMSNVKAKEKLDKLITLRSEIAHRVEASRHVDKSYVVNHAIFCIRLAIKSSNLVREHIKSSIGYYPWSGWSFEKTK